MPQRDPVSRVTALQHFRTTAPDPAFEDRLRGYVRGREGLRGLAGGSTLRLLAPDAGYLRLDRWEGMNELVRSTHAEGYLPRLADAAGPAAVDLHLMVSVGRMPATVPLGEAGRVTVVRASVAERPVRFELDFGALVGHCVTAGDYGGSELLRSVTDPRAYTGLLWWRPGGAGEPEPGTVSTPGFVKRAAELSVSAEVAEFHAVPVGGA
ncbi:hypothetical protein GTW43_22365 [Streptomyces sp. SID5785]|uniref:hypothetical protein n=1 Tax=Streptomyces sp. SID5785 TaxID=2690309 RepID=UPI001361D329|nr:hypothetical protein [Streptomyces sp. SID5785]MZD07804.1 hypothetical protein [Streptomyces sp. SID5785]